MSLFNYLALDGAGSERRGSVDAPDESAARRALLEQGLRALEINSADDRANARALCPDGSVR